MLCSISLIIHLMLPGQIELTGCGDVFDCGIEDAGGRPLHSVLAILYDWRGYILPF